MQWYLTDYSEASHTYIVTSSINVQLKYQWIWLLACQPTATNKLLCFKTFRFIQIFEDFEVKYLPLPESYNTNFNSLL